ncbi:MAG: hypothetical protein K8S16_09290, partial [Bacteroidales bacterium]|nr:hypothetical protein [Bacteroidales bacterium]
MKIIYNVIAFVALMALTGHSVEAEKFSFPDSWGKQGFTLIEENKSQVIINYSLTDFYLQDLEIDGEQLKTVKVPGIFLPNNEGAPDLPGSGKFIAIPQGAIASYEIVSVRTEKLADVEIAPAPRIPFDNENGPLHYEKDTKIYAKNAYYPAEYISLKNSALRGVDVVMLGITPFQYNPVTKELLVIRDIKIKIHISGGNGLIGDERLRSRWWDPIIKDAVLNPDIIPEINYSKKQSGSKTPDYEYIIITPNDPVFISWADSIKNWRNLQGIKTGVVTATEIGGNTTTAIEAYVNDAYHARDFPPAAVLLLGDYGTSRSTVVSPIYNSYCVSDNIYADVDGDQLPDIVFARMTAQTATHLETMITKFLDHERT